MYLKAYNKNILLYVQELISFMAKKYPFITTNTHDVPRLNNTPKLGEKCFVTNQVWMNLINELREFILSLF